MTPLFGVFRILSNIVIKLLADLVNGHKLVTILVKTTLSLAHLFAVTGKRKRDPVTPETRD